MRLKPTCYLAQIPYPDKFHFPPLPIKKKKKAFLDFTEKNTSPILSAVQHRGVSTAALPRPVE